MTDPVLLLSAAYLYGRNSDIIALVDHLVNNIFKTYFKVFQG